MKDFIYSKHTSPKTKYEFAVYRANDYLGPNRAAEDGALYGINLTHEGLTEEVKRVERDLKVFTDCMGGDVKIQLAIKEVGKGVWRDLIPLEEGQQYPMYMIGCDGTVLYATGRNSGTIVVAGDKWGHTVGDTGDTFATSLRENMSHKCFVPMKDPVQISNKTLHKQANKH